MPQTIRARSAPRFLVCIVVTTWKHIFKSRLALSAQQKRNRSGTLIDMQEHIVKTRSLCRAHHVQKQYHPLALLIFDLCQDSAHGLLFLLTTDLGQRGAHSHLHVHGYL